MKNPFATRARVLKDSAKHNLPLQENMHSAGSSKLAECCVEATKTLPAAAVPPPGRAASCHNGSGQGSVSRRDAPACDTPRRTRRGMAQRLFY